MYARRGTIFALGAVLALAIAALALLLLIVYAGVYGRTKAPFTLALLFFAGAFLAQNVLVVYSYGTMMPVVPVALDPYLRGIGILEAPAWPQGSGPRRVDGGRRRNARLFGWDGMPREPCRANP